ncbi:hypothetical protein [Thioclava sp. GXIMD4215]|uniref:hypothetical protein n=1 Tax=Thioclava sp. GXIMD4215 TaxID=3131928 RepID=UPI00311B0661
MTDSASGTARAACRKPATRPARLGVPAAEDTRASLWHPARRRVVKAVMPARLSVRANATPYAVGSHLALSFRATGLALLP